MPKFIYKIRDKQGQEKDGVREAGNEEQLVRELQKEDLLVISVMRQELADKSGLKPKGLRLRLTVDDLVLFARQLATMLEAGVTLLKCLEVLSQQAESRTLLQAIQKVKQDISRGSTFRDAIARHPRVFSEFWVHIVETGEASGALPAALSQLAEYLESAAAMRRKVTSALMYPAVLIVMAIAALTVFTVWIIPIFSKIFGNFGMDLPLITAIVIKVSAFIRQYILFLTLGFTLIAYLLHRYIQTEPGRWQFDSLKLKVPPLASLFQRIAIERFASGLAMLIESGVPILYGLDIVAKATGNKVVEKEVMALKESVRAGKGLAGPLKQSIVFTPMVEQMVNVGEEIGELGTMLRKVSEFYKERISTTLERMGTLIEPIVLVLMGVFVGIIVVALFLPIFELASIARGG